MRICSVEFYPLDHHKMSVFVFSITKQNNFFKAKSFTCYERNVKYVFKMIETNEWKESMLLKENDTKPPALLGICLLLMS